MAQLGRHLLKGSRSAPRLDGPLALPLGASRVQYLPSSAAGGVPGAAPRGPAPAGLDSQKWKEKEAGPGQGLKAWPRVGFRGHR